MKSIIEPVIFALDQRLHPLGFRRKSLVWNRHIGPFIDAIDLQKYSCDNSLTVNCGVLHTEVYRTVFGEKPPVFVKGYEGIVQERINELTDCSGSGGWWDYNALLASPDILINPILKVIPSFMEKMHSEKEMEFFLETRFQKNLLCGSWPVLYLAALKCRLGDKEGAERIIMTDQKNYNERMLRLFGKKSELSLWDLRLEAMTIELGLSLQVKF